MMSDLDRILDDALRSYSAPLPSFGWENRVIARAAGQRRSAPWAWAAITTATALAVVLLFPRDKHVPETIHLSDPELPRVERSLSLPSPRPNLRKARQTRAVVVFPTPAPLTEEERILSDLAARSPLLLEDLFRRQEGPIDIQPIEIPALQVETNNQEN